MVKFTYIIYDSVIYNNRLACFGLGLSRTESVQWTRLSKQASDRTHRARTGKLETERTKGLTKTSLIANRSALKPFPLIKFSNFPIYSDEMALFLLSLPPFDHFLDFLFDHWQILCMNTTGLFLYDTVIDQRFFVSFLMMTRKMKLMMSERCKCLLCSEIQV